MRQFSSIMYDASTLPFEQNLELTQRFVAKQKSNIVIEGACDEIVDATGNERSALTTPERAKIYLNRTGADMIVANLGTEHSANAATLHYHGDLARAIRDEVGHIIVLHGCSSVPPAQIKTLFDDGICKANIWAALERDTSPVLFQRMVENAAKIIGPKRVQQLMVEGYLGEKCRTADTLSLQHFTTVYRQDIVFQAMKDIVRSYLQLWYRD